MKNKITLILLVCWVVSLAGCSLPTSGNGEQTTGTTTQGKATQGSATQNGATQGSATQGSATQNGVTQGSATQSGARQGSIQSGATQSSSTQGSTMQGIAKQGGEKAAKEAAATGTENAEAISGAIPVTLYYQDGDGYLIPVTRRIAKQTGIAKAALNCLVDSALNREDIAYFGLYPVLPKGTEVIGMSIRDGTAVVDFNGKFLDYADKNGERNAICSVVYTLTGFKTIRDVKILVNGKNNGKLKYDSDISGVLSRENTMVNTNKVNLGTGVEKSDAYFFKNVKGTFTYILPVSGEHPETTEDEKPAVIMDLLMKGSKDKKLFSEIPAGASLLESSVNNRLVTLDFDDEILKYGGNAREEGILGQILYSMAQVKDADKVRIMVEGKTATLPEGTDISKALPLPAVINDMIDE